MTPAPLIIDTAAAATAFGLAGFAGQLGWPLLKRRDHILTAQLGIACCYAAHYALQDVRSAAAICLLGATQTTVTLLSGDRPRHPLMTPVFLGLVMLTGALTFTGPATLLAVAACALVMLGRMQRCTLRMRALMLAATPFGIGHDLVVGALPALAGALLSATVAACALRAEMSARRPHATRPAGRTQP